MNQALFFTFCSLAFTAVNDIIFKLVTGKIKSRGGFITIVGLIELLCLGFLPMSLGPKPVLGMFLCILAGACSLIANIFLIESMRFQSASLSSTIYRLNMVFVFLGACIFLQESISGLQWLGMLMAVFAVCIFTKKKASDRSSYKGVALAVTASLMRGAMGLFYKQAINIGTSANALTIVTAVSWFIGGFIYSLMRDPNLKWITDKNTYLFSIISGLLVSGIVFCMAHSLNLGKASIMLPIAQMSFVVTFFLEVIFLHEKVNPRKLLALGGCIAAVVLLISGGN